VNGGKNGKSHRIEGSVNINAMWVWMRLVEKVTSAL
jgi:hypothetical protein